MELVTYKNIVVALPALIHVYIMYLEMFLWVKKRKVFGMSEEQALQTKTLAFNQGLYNGFLAIGLIWSFFIADICWGIRVQGFFLTCILIAGIVGAKTVSGRIFWVQAAPALLGLLMISMCWFVIRCG
ncbi:MAG: DUF1304 domain-containing protein [Bdellovibrionaceae bacterium]|nr:DUF1304 domain-containing protein [Pseudobdellovibrionaceae bacterium]